MKLKQFQQNKIIIKGKKVKILKLNHILTKIVLLTFYMSVKKCFNINFLYTRLKVYEPTDDFKAKIKLGKIINIVYLSIKYNECNEE